MSYLFVTMGDPSGIGPEIIIKSLLQKKIRELHPIIVGSRKVLEYTLQALHLPFQIKDWKDDSADHDSDQVIGVEDVDTVDMSVYSLGKITQEYGFSAYQYLKVAVGLAQKYPGSKVITAPIHKGALKLAGIQEAGHTELLQSLTNSPKVMTMFTVDNLRVFFYTRHLSLMQAIRALNTNGLVAYLKDMHDYLSCSGISCPLLALAALNPHASDDGLFGDEEKNILQPAVQIASNLGFQVIGPVPADSVFHQGLQGKYSAILSLYHDQGHIACKTYSFERTISVTFGLPFLRISVDHGTAFDIAGKWIASSISMETAILKGVKI